MGKHLVDTAIGWAPTQAQLEAIDLLASGYSMNAVSRQTGTPLSTLNMWVNENSYCEQFRERIAERAQTFRENLEAIEDQQVVMATGLLQKALNGEFTRDSTGGRPLQLDAALELLRATRWKERAGGHKAFGAS